MTPFFPFSWKELFDVLLISFLLHRLYLLFRGTTALQVAVSFFFLWLFSIAAEAAGLVLMTRFFQAMAAVAAIAGIVVFRSEIRSVLLHTNPLRFFLGQRVASSWNDPEEIAEAVFRLADRRIGGLICLQRRDNVEEFVEAGTRLDGHFSGAILESIFVEESPVHDGAVVVQEGRISRIGCILPLTAQKDLPGKFGTRHRAAFGLSEECDAAVLVVSEERGTVSLVHRGRLKTMENPSMLVRRLQDLNGKSAKRRPAFRGFLVEGIRQTAGLAVLFLMISLLWNLYLGSGHSLVSFRVPVEFRNVPENTVVIHDFDEEFAVRISGKKPLVESLQQNQVSAFIDLAGLSFGKHSIGIGEKNFRLPPGLTIEQIAPGNVEIDLEPHVTREVPIEIVFSDDFPEELRAVSVTAIPGVVRISGPQSQVDPIGSVATVPVSLESLDRSQEKAIILTRLASLPPFVSLAEGEKREVKIAVDFKAKKPEKEDLWPIIPPLIRS